MGVKVIGGQKNFQYLTSDLLSIDEKGYELLKVKCWLKSLNEGDKPIKWLKPNKKGTKLNFELLESEVEFLIEIEKLKKYIEKMNKQLGTDWKIKIK